MMFKPISPHALLDIAQNIALMVSSQRRIRVGHFASYLWRAVARQFTPTPRELKVEINPNLRTHYSRENRTFVVTLSLAPKGEDLASQFIMSGASAGAGPMTAAGGLAATSGGGASSAYVELTDQQRVLKAEMEAEKKLMQETQEQRQMMDRAGELLEVEGKTREGEREKRVDDQLLLKQEEQFGAAKEKYEKLEQVEQIMTHQPTEMEQSAAAPAGTTLAGTEIADKLGPMATQAGATSEVKGRYEQRVETGAVDTSLVDKRAAEPVDRATEEFVEQAEKKEDIEELRLFNEILRNEIRSRYHVRIAKNPEIISAAEEGGGDQIVFEVWTHSFTDTQRINANMRPIFRP
ncbi:MAG: hypothetical protein ACE5PV_06185 [Candidatus Poribacteria bacterium]